MPKSMPRKRPRFSATGFTMIELMITLIIIGVVISGLWTAFSGTTGRFNIQKEILNTQENLRFAMDQIKGDIRKAGFLATPNSSKDALLCNQRNHQGIIMVDGNSGNCATSVYNPGVNQYIYPDKITLLGNFVNGEIFMIQQISNQIFTLYPNGDYIKNFPTSQTEFNAIFKPNYMVKVFNVLNYGQILPIQSSDYSSRSVTLTSAPVKSQSLCAVDPTCRTCRLTVLSYIRYSLQFDPNNPQKTDLVKEILDLNQNRIAGPYVVAEYIVDLQIWFMADTSGGYGSDPQIPADTNPLDTIGNVPNSYADGTTSAKPERIRSVFVRLAARTRTEDTTFPFVAKTNADAPLRAYDLDTQTPNYGARVRTLTSEIEVRNITLARVK